MDGTQDISKIIGIIMENPDIIEKIKSLADNSTPTASAEANPTAQAGADTVSETAVSEAGGEVSTYAKGGDKKRRRELLCALKPYVKSERARAIDTMLSVIDVLDVMKVR